MKTNTEVETETRKTIEFVEKWLNHPPSVTLSEIRTLSDSSLKLWQDVFLSKTFASEVWKYEESLTWVAYSAIEPILKVYEDCSTIPTVLNFRRLLVIECVESYNERIKEGV